MSKVNYAVVFSSITYREVIYSALNRNDMIFIEPVTEDEKSLSEYVKRDTAEISNYDSFVIDLGVLKDTDEQIIEALETIRFFDDKVRIIILEGNRTNSEKLLSQCFLNGIYNLIPLMDFIQTKKSLEKCLLEGMSYKDALHFKDAEARKIKKHAKREVCEFHGKVIAFLGTQKRIGTTHCVLAAAYTLRKCGYLIAVVDYTGSQDYLEFMNSYEQQLDENNSFVVDDIDFYINPESEELVSQEHSYNFIVYDYGSCVDAELQDRYLNADEKVLVVGSKPWELPMLATFLRDSTGNTEEIKFLFNMTSSDLESDLRKMMKAAGIEKSVYFMEYMNNYFSVSEVMKSMLQVVPQKMRKGWFRKR